MGVMCLARWKPRISFLFLPTGRDLGLDRGRDQPPLKLVTSGAGWCNLVARVRAPHPGSGKSMLSQCSVSEMRESVSSVRGDAAQIHVSGHPYSWHVSTAPTFRYTWDESKLWSQSYKCLNWIKCCDVIMKERACLICAVLSGDIPLLSHSFLKIVTQDGAALGCNVLLLFLYILICWL